MDEGRPFHSDVDKSRLHAWKDFDDLPFVDVPDEIFRLGPIHIQFRQHPMIQHRHSGLFPRHIDRYF